MQLMMQELIEKEATEFLQRGHYERKDEGSQKGYRNRYEIQKVKTGEGEIPISFSPIFMMAGAGLNLTAMLVFC
ncbi:MAG: transposase [Nitrospirota bacterium]|nr:transposase [Nitrospirota bacterium]MDH5769282.1 transposase [Nitrospirota bacterium]